MTNILLPQKATKKEERNLSWKARN